MLLLVQVTTNGEMPEGLPATATIAGADLSFRFALWIPSTPARKAVEMDPEEDIPPPRVLLLSKVTIFTSLCTTPGYTAEYP